MTQVNYDKIWRWGNAAEKKDDNIQNILSSFTARQGNLLEIGPGNKPQIPIAGSYFFDISKNATNFLAKRGGRARCGDLEKGLPYPNDFFHTICAFEVLEHIDNDQAALKEIRRVLHPDGIFIFSVPTFMHHWTPIDNLVGHKRLYAPEELIIQLQATKLSPRQVYIIEEKILSHFLRSPVGRMLTLIPYALMLLFPTFFYQFSHITFVPLISKAQRPQRFSKDISRIPKTTRRVIIVCKK